MCFVGAKTTTTLLYIIIVATLQQIIMRHIIDIYLLFMVNKDFQKKFHSCKHNPAMQPSTGYVFGTQSAALSLIEQYSEKL